MRVGAVGAALRAEDQTSGGVEVPQEAEVRLFAVEAAIEVEDAVHRVAVAEDVEEASVSPLISIRCRHSFLIMIYASRSLHFNYPIPWSSSSLITSWTQQMSAAVPYKAYQVG